MCVFMYALDFQLFKSLDSLLTNKNQQTKQLEIST